MVKAVVTGAAGKMGSRIIALISATDGIETVGAVEQATHPSIGKDAGENLAIGRIGANIEPDLQNCIEKGNVVIDFTSHEASIRNLEIAAEKGCAIVIGSTGFTPAEMKKAEKLAELVPCVLSPNMSVGVNVMFDVLNIAAGILGDDYDVEIMEAHHNLKKDAPSGTAMKMAGIIAETLGRDLKEVGVYNRKGLIGERTKKEIGIQSLRAGDIVGDHMVMFCGMGERLEFVHRAHSRDNFAKGAIRAAKWVVGRKNGLYDMQDVLELRKI